MLRQSQIVKLACWVLIYFTCWLVSFAWFIGERHLLRQYFVWCFTFTGFELPFAVLLLSIFLFIAIIALFFIGRLILRNYVHRPNP